MTITRRNRLRRRIASTLAERDGRDAELQHEADVATLPEGRHYTRCCSDAYDRAARDTYHHLTDSRVYRGRAGVRLGIGLPQLQRMLGEIDAAPPAG